MPVSYSVRHSLANCPDWISVRIFFISAEYGDLTRGPRVVNAQTKAEMKKILTEIQTGQFAKEWRSEYEGGMKNFKRLYEADNTHPVEVTGR